MRRFCTGFLVAFILTTSLANAKMDKLGAPFAYYVNSISWNMEDFPSGINILIPNFWDFDGESITLYFMHEGKQTGTLTGSKEIVSSNDWQQFKRVMPGDTVVLKEKEHYGSKYFVPEVIASKYFQ